MVVLKTVVKVKVDEGAKIDAQDMHLAHGVNWSLDSNGYVIGHRDSETVRLHRVIMSLVLGRDLQTKELVDHINGDRADNRRANLRLATHEQNSWNRHAKPKAATGYRGVYLIPTSGNYMAYITHGGRQQQLGVYATPEEAAQAYNTKAIELRGDRATLNDIPEGITPRPILRKTGATPGVRPHGNRFAARKKIKGKEYHVGVFDTADEAAAARATFVPT